LLVLCGATRANKRFAREAARLVAAMGQEAEFLDLKDYPMPPYDGDIETSTGLPEATNALGQKIRAADALILSTPEYNGSIPGILKTSLTALP